MLSRARDDDLESEQAGDLYQRFLREGIVFVRGAIDEKLSNAVIAQLLYADQEAGEEPLSVYVNSSGGDLRAALAIYDTMHTVHSGDGFNLGALVHPFHLPLLFDQHGDHIVVADQADNRALGLPVLYQHPHPCPRSEWTSVLVCSLFTGLHPHLHG